MSLLPHLFGNINAYFKISDLVVTPYRECVVMAAQPYSCICRNLEEKPNFLDLEHRAKSGCSYCQLIYDVISDLTSVHKRTSGPKQISETTAAESHIELLDECVKIRWKNSEEEYFQIFNPDSFSKTTAELRDL